MRCSACLRQRRIFARRSTCRQAPAASRPRRRARRACAAGALRERNAAPAAARWPSTASICDGKTLTPRMISMSSLRPLTRSMRRMVRAVPGSSRGQIAGAIADDRHGFLGQRGEDQFAGLAVGQHAAGVRIDDLGKEVILPERQPILASRGIPGRRRVRSPPRVRRDRARRCPCAARFQPAWSRSTARRRICRRAGCSRRASSPWRSNSSAIASI